MKEIEKLLQDDILEEIKSPLRAQACVDKKENHKK